MPRTERSIALPTGMIIGGLYAILLVSFVQESSMRRDAVRRTDGAAVWPVVHDVSKRVCRFDPRLCPPADAADPQDCLTSIDAVRALIDGPGEALRLEGLQRALRAQR